MRPSMTVVEMLTLFMAHVANLLAESVETMTVGPGLDAFASLHTDLVYQRKLAMAYRETKRHLDSILDEPEYVRSSEVALKELDELLVAQAFRVPKSAVDVWIEDHLRELRAGNLNAVKPGLGGPTTTPVWVES
jgi:hypothetical protein